MAKKRMLVLCPFPQGVAAGQRLKYEQYFDRWRADGWEVDVSPFMDDAMWKVAYRPGHTGAKIAGVLRGHVRRLRDIFRLPGYDLVYVFMYVTPFLTSIMERKVRTLAKRLVYDVEDNILVEQNLPKEMNPNSIARLIKGPGKARFLIRSADHVITSSPFLNDYCLKMNSAGACTYVSSSVDTDRFQPATSYSNDCPITIGWTGTYSSKVFLDQLRGVFARLAERLPFKLRVIGNFDYELPGIDLEVVRWSAESEVRDLQALDIGVYPLPIDDWVLGKSGLKAIQYMAFALPCVATEVGTNLMLVTDRVNGRLVSTDDEWVDALEELIRDADLRRRLGEQARRDAVANYSLRAIGEKYDEILRDLMGENDMIKGKRIYIAGSAGMLGEAFHKLYGAHNSLRCTDKDVNDSWLEFLDFRDTDAYIRDVEAFKPDYLFHLGAHTSLEFCEQDPDDAYATNTIAVETAVLIANRLAIPLLYISTAGIFDGKQGTYDDWDDPAPLGHYARSKYMGERFVSQNLHRHLVCRAGWMMGAGPSKDKKFIQKLMAQVKAGKTELQVVDDKLGTPTYTHDFARNVALLLDREYWGIYNMVCGGVTSRLEVAQELIRIIGKAGEIVVTPVSSDFFAKEYFAARPPSERLITKKLDLRGCNIMRDWRVCLREYLNDYYKGYLS